MKAPALSLPLCAAMAALILCASCNKNDGNSMPAQPTTSVKITANATLGNIITDSAGRSLYFFAKDAGSTSACTGPCLATWPAFYKEELTHGDGLQDSDFAVITRTDGAKQTTYKGWPLYYYSADAAAGDVKGDAFNKVWAAAKADYSVMFANAQLVGHDGLNYKADGTAGDGVSTYLTDPYGRTLYMFFKDSTNTNKFTKADFSNNGVWPIDEVNAMGSIPTVFDKTQFVTISVFGKTQLVFRGHPLYMFGMDGGLRGNTKGVSFPTPGAGIWKVLNNESDILH